MQLSKTNYFRPDSGTVQFFDYKTSYTSRRDAFGELVLETCPLNRGWGRTIGPRSPTSFNSGFLGNQGDPYYYNDLPSAIKWRCPSLYRTCYSRFKTDVWSDAQAAIAVDIAEGHQTLKMLGDTLGSLARGAILIKRGQFKAAAKYWGIQKPKNLGDFNTRFAQNWLAFRYGWLPLLSSIESWHKAYKSPMSDHFVRSSATEFWHNWDSNGKSRITMKAKVVVTSGNLARLNQYGLVNPLSVAWELIPFSFVVDWFLPIGNYLESLTDFVGLGFEEASTTYFHSGTYYIFYNGTEYAWYPDRITGGRLDPMSYMGKYDAPGRGCIFRLKCRQTTAPARPSLTVGTGFNPKRALDSLALLTSTLLKGR